MAHPFAEVVALALLAGTLAFAVARPRGLPEAAGAVPAALLVVVLGILPPAHALDELRGLAPTVGFLAAVLLLSDLCDRAGLFAWAGQAMARASGGRPVPLLATVFVVASAITAVLSLDATIVLLTPVVFATAASLRLRQKPQVYACTHLANTASLLLPVSNLTNLLAFRASHLSFAHFAGLMALPWLAAIAVEFVVFRFVFSTDLVGRGREPADGRSTDRRVAPPALPIVVLALTLAGFTLSQTLGVDPAVVAAIGAVALAVPALARRSVTVPDVVRAIDLWFLAFVLALGVVVRAASDGGLGAFAERIAPSDASMLGLLAMALLAAVLANMVNNLPAILILVPAAVRGGPALVLAALIGVNIGPNLTYVGSLATLLWRRLLRARDAEPATSEFFRLGAVTVPACLAVSVPLLWLSTRLFGG